MENYDFRPLHGHISDLFFFQFYHGTEDDNTESCLKKTKVDIRKFVFTNGSLDKPNSNHNSNPWLRKLHYLNWRMKLIMYSYQ